jgi:hypothetical protein
MTAAREPQLVATTLPEPQVLAHTKRRLFPDGGDGYAVADTEFATDRWLDDQPVPAEVREALAPFNHVRVGSGYPDLVGVRALENDLLSVDRFGDPPLVAVEAKGYAGGTVDVERGIAQAHDRLGEANVAFVAAPAAAVTNTNRTLARDLNVGVLAVEPAGGVEVLERPRVVGNQTTTETSAIRFQAGAQGVTDRSFGLNHPKNYLGYAVAVSTDGATDALVDDHVVGAVADARRGAAFLGLVAEAPHGPKLTGLGREVVRFAVRHEGSLGDALARFEGWQGSARRFCDLDAAWGQLARRVVYDYPATELLVEELQTMHADGIDDPTLVDLVIWLHEHHPTFTVELFVRGTEDARERVLAPDGELRERALHDGAVYHSPTVFQLKAMLYHAGLVATRGAEPSALDPTADSWRLRDSVDPT